MVLTIFMTQLIYFLKMAIILNTFNLQYLFKSLTAEKKTPSLLWNVLEKILNPKRSPDVLLEFKKETNPVIVVNLS